MLICFDLSSYHLFVSLVLAYDLTKFTFKTFVNYV